MTYSGIVEYVFDEVDRVIASLEERPTLRRD
jgi:hypothetical protein